jgi:hypothetical protein
VARRLNPLCIERIENWTDRRAPERAPSIDAANCRLRLAECLIENQLRNQL